VAVREMAVKVRELGGKVERGGIIREMGDAS
jgi:hypothetical protein